MDNGADRHVNERLGEGLGVTHPFLPSEAIEEDLRYIVDHWRPDHYTCGPAPPTTSLHLVCFPVLWRGLDLLAVFTQERWQTPPRDDVTFHGSGSVNDADNSMTSPKSGPRWLTGPAHTGTLKEIKIQILEGLLNKEGAHVMSRMSVFVFTH